MNIIKVSLNCIMSYWISLLLFSCSTVVTTEYAEVQKITVSEKSNGYHFAVELKSPDTGCNQYADWWEVLDENNQLLYRRILAHSHVNEQPFTRSGGPIKAEADQVLLVRAHMNNTGYGRQAMKGTIAGGFRSVELPENYAKELANQSPQPDGCRF